MMLSFFFIHTSVVTNILSKSKHTLCGQVLEVKLYKPLSVVEEEVYELNQIKVETSDTLARNFIMVVICSKLNLEEEEISLQMLNENSYIVTFQSTYSFDGELT